MLQFGERVRILDEVVGLRENGCDLLTDTNHLNPLTRDLKRTVHANKVGEIIYISEQWTLEDNEASRYVNEVRGSG